MNQKKKSFEQTGNFKVERLYPEKGNSKALEYFNKLSNKEKIKLLKLVKKMGDFGYINNKTQFNNEGDKIYAFKPQPDRFLCFFYKGKKLIITNAFHKKTQKLPMNEKETALKYMNDYIIRIENGGYYE